MMRFIICVAVSVIVMANASDWKVALGTPIVLIIALLVHDVISRKRKFDSAFNEVGVSHGQSSTRIKGILGQGVGVDKRNQKLILITSKKRSRTVAFSDLMETKVRLMNRGHDTQYSILVFMIHDENNPLVEVEFPGRRAETALARLKVMGIFK